MDDGNFVCLKCKIFKYKDMSFYESYAYLKYKISQEDEKLKQIRKIKYREKYIDKYISKNYPNLDRIELEKYISDFISKNGKTPLKVIVYKYCKDNNIETDIKISDKIKKEIFI